MPIALLTLTQQQFGDVSFTGAEIAFLVFVIGPLISVIVGMAKYIVNGKDKEIATLKELLKVTTRTTERSVATADRSVEVTKSTVASLTKEQLSELAVLIYEKQRGEDA